MANRDFYVDTDSNWPAPNGSFDFPYKTLQAWRDQEFTLAPVQPTVIPVGDTWTVHCSGVTEDATKCDLLAAELTVNGTLILWGNNRTGMWSTAHYRRTNAGQPGMFLDIKNFALLDFQTENMTGGSPCISTGAYGGTTVIARCLSFCTGGNAWEFRTGTQDPIVMYVYNNLIHGAHRALGFTWHHTNSVFHVYNNTMVDNVDAGILFFNSGTPADAASCTYIAINNISVGAGSQDYFYHDTSHPGIMTFCNVASDTTSRDGANYKNQTVIFNKDRGGDARDYRLHVDDRGARRKGLGDILDGRAPKFDIEGNARGDFPIDCGLSEVQGDEPTVRNWYVDTDYVGTSTGSESQPFKRLVDWQTTRAEPDGGTIGFNEVYHVWCKGVAADVDSVTLDSWRATDLFAIRLHGDAIEGVWDTSKYRIEAFSRGGVGPPSAPLVLRSGTENFFMDRLQVRNTSTSSITAPINAVLDQAGGYGGYYGCIFKIEDRGNSESGPILDMSDPLSDALRYVGNCLLINGTSGLECENPANSVQLIWVNNTLIGGLNTTGAVGIRAAGITTALYANNLSDRWSGDDYAIVAATGEKTFNNVSSDMSSPDAGKLSASGEVFTGRTFTYKSPGIEDYRLSANPLDEGAIGMGLGYDIIGMVPQVDIQGLARGMTVTPCGYSLIAASDFPEFNSSFTHRANILL